MIERLIGEDGAGEGTLTLDSSSECGVGLAVPATEVEEEGL